MSCSCNELGSKEVIKPESERENLMLTDLEQLFILPSVLFAEERAIIRMFMFTISSLIN